jgi:ubiquinone/menaquinone biosynthesis C-methylase UbiE
MMSKVRAEDNGGSVNSGESREMRTLSHEEARAFYDWFGAKQDSQRFYEDPAVADLIIHAEFDQARSVYEFGCGTGRLAERLLSGYLPPDCRYQAVDISATMVRLAQERLAQCGERVRVGQTLGSMIAAAPDASFDRFVSSYVLDLLSDEDIRTLLAEAHRVLEPGGLLCTVGLTHGTSPSAKVAGWVWQGLFRVNPKAVGGCRAVVVEEHLDDSSWSVRYSNVITRFGISSEVLVAAHRTANGNST